MTKRTELQLSLGIVITVMLMVSGIAATHFLGIAAAESNANYYTDKRVDRLKGDLKDILIKINKNLEEQGKAIVRIETKMGG